MCLWARCLWARTADFLMLGKVHHLREGNGFHMKRFCFLAILNNERRGPPKLSIIKSMKAFHIEYTDLR